MAFARASSFLTPSQSWYRMDNLVGGQQQQMSRETRFETTVYYGREAKQSM
jgi:hypothetical protein